jgi:hypothetical protein
MKYPDINHSNLGLLKYYDEYDWYAGKLNSQGLSIDISIHIDKKNKIGTVLAKIDPFIDRVETYIETAKDYAVEQLLGIKNDTWLDEDEEAVTPERFKSLMSLESIVIYPDGAVEFYHHDGDLFWGHCILVRMDEQHKFISAETSG